MCGIASALHIFFFCMAVVVVGFSWNLICKKHPQGYRLSSWSVVANKKILEGEHRSCYIKGNHRWVNRGRRRREKILPTAEETLLSIIEGGWIGTGADVSVDMKGRDHNSRQQPLCDWCAGRTGCFIGSEEPTVPTHENPFRLQDWQKWVQRGRDFNRGM